MKNEVKQELKEKGQLGIFSEIRYKKTVEVMKYAVSKDARLKEFLNTSPDFKASWISDHMIKFVEEGMI